ncbi:MAG: OmpA family protein [Spirochaetaceae bacterium]|jgi:outer membrane protein OmpA-like peptidoglycan-associated protein|nr:OmpA family protein [Spirochaetaceae bacterium]
MRSPVVLCVSLTAILFSLPAALFAGIFDSGALSAASFIDWTQHTLTSDLSLDMRAAGLAMPAGKNSARAAVISRIPALLKDAVLSTNVDSETQLGDMVSRRGLNLEDISQIIDSGKQSVGHFSLDGNTFFITHRLNLESLYTPLVRHRVPYTPKTPLEQTATRPYTGILIDARGMLPVQGEFISARGEACFFPKIWDETMDLLYERGMMDVEGAKKNGIAGYDYSSDEGRYRSRIGANPLRIIARKIFGLNHTDPVISREDALKILSSSENLTLLENGRIVILLDEDILRHPVAVADKDMNYWVNYGKMRDRLLEVTPPVIPEDTHRGIEISIQELKFLPNLTELLPEERERLSIIADTLRPFIGDDYTIRVDGHTADIGEPGAEMNLSLQRAETVVREMAARGIPLELFTWQGHGGTRPLFDNTPAEGRSQNRRVTILVGPRTIQERRNWGGD